MRRYSLRCKEGIEHDLCICSPMRSRNLQSLRESVTNFKSSFDAAVLFDAQLDKFCDEPL